MPHEGVLCRRQFQTLSVVRAVAVEAVVVRGATGDAEDVHHVHVLRVHTYEHESASVDSRESGVSGFSFCLHHLHTLARKETNQAPRRQRLVLAVDQNGRVTQTVRFPALELPRDPARRVAHVGGQIVAVGQHVHGQFVPVTVRLGAFVEIQHHVHAVRRTFPATQNGKPGIVEKLALLAPTHPCRSGGVDLALVKKGPKSRRIASGPQILALVLTQQAHFRHTVDQAVGPHAHLRSRVHRVTDRREAAVAVHPQRERDDLPHRPFARVQVEAVQPLGQFGDVLRVVKAVADRVVPPLAIPEEAVAHQERQIVRPLEQALAQLRARQAAGHVDQGAVRGHQEVARSDWDCPVDELQRKAEQVVFHVQREVGRRHPTVAVQVGKAACGEKGRQAVVA